MIDQLKNFVNTLEAYLDAKATEFRLGMQEELKRAGRKLALSFGIALMLAFFIFFFSLGLALLVNEWTQSPYAGFLVVSALYLVGGLAMLGFLRQELVETKDKAPEQVTIIEPSTESNNAQ